jgi:hypothetical protein
MLSSLPPLDVDRVRCREGEEKKVLFFVAHADPLRVVDTDSERGSQHPAISQAVGNISEQSLSILFTSTYTPVPCSIPVAPLSASSSWRSLP